MADYINNEHLQELITLCKDNPNNETIQTELFKEFRTLAKHVYCGFGFKYKKTVPMESIDDVAADCLMKIDKYHLGKGKAFSYFTEVIKNGYFTVYNKVITQGRHDELFAKLAETKFASSKEEREIVRKIKQREE